MLPRWLPLTSVQSGPAALQPCISAHPPNLCMQAATTWAATPVQLMACWCTECGRRQPAWMLPVTCLRTAERDSMCDPRERATPVLSTLPISYSTSALHMQSSWWQKCMGAGTASSMGTRNTSRERGGTGLESNRGKHTYQGLRCVLLVLGSWPRKHNRQIQSKKTA